MLELIIKRGKGEFGACASVNLIKNLIYGHCCIFQYCLHNDKVFCWLEMQASKRSSHLLCFHITRNKITMQVAPKSPFGYPKMETGLKMPDPNHPPTEVFRVWRWHLTNCVHSYNAPRAMKHGSCIMNHSSPTQP